MSEMDAHSTSGVTASGTLREALFIFGKYHLQLLVIAIARWKRQMANGSKWRIKQRLLP